MTQYIQKRAQIKRLFSIILLLILPLSLAQANDSTINVSASFKQAALVQVTRLNDNKIIVTSQDLKTHKAFIQTLKRTKQGAVQLTDTHKTLTSHYDLVVYF